MPSTVFHTLLGCCAARWVGVPLGEPRSLLWVFCFSNLPDVDLLVGLLTGDPFRFHRLLTHALFPYLTLAVLVAPVVQDRRPLALALWLVLLHLLADSLSGPRVGLGRSYGLPLLWPLSSAKAALPVVLFPSPWREPLVCRHNLAVLLWEVALGASLCLLLRRKRGEVV